MEDRYTLMQEMLEVVKVTQAITSSISLVR